MMNYPASDFDRASALAPLEFKSEGDDDADPAKAIERLGTALDEKIAGFTTELKSATDRIDAEIARLKRPKLSDDDAENDELERKAFEKFVRKGQQALEPDEFKLLQVSDDVAGGYTAPGVFIAELLRNVALFSPIRQFARVMAIGGKSATLPRRTGGMTAAWVGEVQARPETTVTFGANEYPVFELAAYVDVSNSMLEDSAFNINDELAFDFAEEFGAKESEAFVTGNGVARPHGFMADSDIGFTVSGAAATV